MRQLHMVVVDDDPHVRALVVALLKERYPAAHVTDLGDRASFEAVLAHTPCDLVVSNNALQWGTGEDIVVAVRNQHPGASVIVVTGSDEPERQQRLSKLGAVVLSPSVLVSGRFEDAVERCLFETPGIRPKPDRRARR